MFVRFGPMFAPPLDIPGAAVKRNTSKNAMEKSINFHHPDEFFYALECVFRGHVFASYFSFIVLPNRQARRFALVACRARVYCVRFSNTRAPPPPSLGHNHCRHVLDHYSLVRLILREPSGKWICSMLLQSQRRDAKARFRAGIIPKPFSCRTNLLTPQRTILISEKLSI